MITVTAASAPRPEGVDAQLRTAVEALHAAQVPCLDDAELLAVLVAVAATCGPCS